MPNLIDTHCHLDIIEENGQSIKDSVEKSTLAGVSKIVQIGIDYKTSVRADNICKEFSTPDLEILYTIGCHPAYKSNFTQKEEIIWLVQEKKNNLDFVGIGEIGLDFYHDKNSIEEQTPIFVSFLDLASDLNLPVIIHSREAAEATYQVLSKYKMKVFGVIHCFTYDYEYAKKFCDLGFYISFSGIVAFKNAKEIHEAAKKLPLKSILIETDSPFLAPPPFRGKRNDSSNLTYILEKFFSLRSEPNTLVEETIYENSLKFISRKAP
ncbi:MAG: TatD family hydrolase [Leptospiraceae bacterium]|nr:TatD family hydrolase [Leptospiraceae bacterium]MCK6379953.1 TatD family hydrolase [Leptospiraceae bacterium]NUM40087.1 TatD family hydrolase [Leptospiraceae bacterium]